VFIFSAGITVIPIFKALKVRPQREVRFCKKIDDDFLEMLNRKKPKDIEEVPQLYNQDHNQIDFHIAV